MHEILSEVPPTNPEVVELRKHVIDLIQVVDSLRSRIEALEAWNRPIG